MTFAGTIDSATVLQLLGHMPVALLCADDIGTVTYANKAARDLIGSAGPLEALSLTELFPGWPKAPHEQSGAFDLQLATASGPVAVEVSVCRGGETTPAIALVLRRSAATPNQETIEEARLQAVAALADARSAERRMRDIIDMLPHAVCVFDAQDRYVLWNEKYTETYPEIAGLLSPGAAFTDMLRASIDSGEARESMDDPEGWLTDRLARHALPFSQEEQLLRDGRWLRHDDRRLANGGAIGMRIDITELKQRETSVRLLFQDNPVPMLTVDPESLMILDANAAATAFYGASRDILLASTVPDLHVEDDRMRALETFAGMDEVYDGRSVWRHHNARGDEISVLMFVRSMTHESRRMLLVAIADVTDRVRAEAQMHYLAYHDVLTSLANRVQFHAGLDEALGKSAEGHREVALYCLDLDGFKPVNDELGHRGGDRLLQLVAARLKAAVRNTDLVARLGGDEFAVLQRIAPDNPALLAARLIEALRPSFEIDGRLMTIGVSIGIAAGRAGQISVDELLTAADAALYEAKRAGKNTWRISRTHHLVVTSAGWPALDFVRGPSPLPEAERHEVRAQQPTAGCRTGSPVSATLRLG